MPSEQPRYLLELQALPDRVPPEVRLRLLLKALQRGAYRLRCVRVEEIPAALPASPASTDACTAPDPKESR